MFSFLLRKTPKSERKRKKLNWFIRSPKISCFLTPHFLQAFEHLFGDLVVLGPTHGTMLFKLHLLSWTSETFRIRIVLSLNLLGVTLFQDRKGTQTPCPWYDYCLNPEKCSSLWGTFLWNQHFSDLRQKNFLRECSSLYGSFLQTDKYTGSGSVTKAKRYQIIKSNKWYHIIHEV